MVANTTTIFETTNSVYMLRETKTDKFGNFATLTMLHGSDIPGIQHMQPIDVDAFETPKIGASFRAYLVMQDTDTVERFITSTVKSVIVK